MIPFPTHVLARHAGSAQPGELSWRPLTQLIPPQFYAVDEREQAQEVLAYA
jgi:hypothetical protein